MLDNIITEEQLLERLCNSKKVILLEPNYRRKYIPLGLSKIATFIKKNGGEVFFQRKYKPVGENLVCVTSLFTYESQKVLETIRPIGHNNIIVGGIYASLMPEHLTVELSKGLIPKQISIFKGTSKILDSYPPDYSIDWQLEKDWDKFSFVFTTRGCPNKCGYCAVWRLEPQRWINEKWKEHIDMNKPYVMISDNNLSAMPIEHIRDICKFISDNKKRVVFDNGLDCKYITDELAEVLASVKYHSYGLRLAFDRISEDGIFQKAVEKLKSKGIKKTSIMSYVLFNFNDTPKEAIYRMEECIRLGIRPYPQCYTPLNRSDRKENKFIGPHWTANLIRAFRYFYLMAGFYQKQTFREYITKYGDKYNLTEEEWKKINL